jgi:hypothetical protein
MKAYDMESVKSLSMLTLSKALKNGQLQEFIAQEEHLERGQADRHSFDEVIKKAVTKHQSQDQTSGSHVRGGSTGK